MPAVPEELPRIEAHSPAREETPWSAAWSLALECNELPRRGAGMPWEAQLYDLHVWERTDSLVPCPHPSSGHVGEDAELTEDCAAHL